MKRSGREYLTTKGPRKIITAAIVGSLVGAAVGLLISPKSRKALRRRISSGPMDARERMKSAADNVESSARALATGVKEDLEEVKGTVYRRGNLTTPEQPER